MRKMPVPTLNSAREFLSVQRLSEVVSGRLRVASTQSCVPCGCMETWPVTYCRRATRPGGSSSAQRSVAESNSIKSDTKIARVFMAPLLNKRLLKSLKVATPRKGAVDLTLSSKGVNPDWLVKLRGKDALDAMG